MISHTAFHFAIGVMLLRTTAFAQAPMDSTVPPDAEIRQILAGRIGGENLGIGMVAGVIDAKGRRVVAYGSLAKDDKRPLNGDTVFEIGSITKVFTSLLLMDMVQRGEVALTDPVSKYLPPSVKVPERRNRDPRPDPVQHEFGRSKTKLGRQAMPVNRSFQKENGPPMNVQISKGVFLSAFIGVYRRPSLLSFFAVFFHLAVGSLSTQCL